MNGGQDCFGPEGMRSRCGDEEGTSGFDDVPMFPFCNPILFVGVWAGLLMDGTMRLGDLAHSGREKFLSTVRAKGLDATPKLSLDHGGEGMINSRYFRPMSEKVYPRAAREIINETNIIKVARVRSNRGRTPNIRMN